MEEMTISLIPYNKTPLELELHPEVPSSNINPLSIDEYYTVYSDSQYSFRIHGINISEIETFSVFINDEEEICKVDSTGQIWFQNALGRNNYPFQDHLGFVVISLMIEHSGKKSMFYTDYLSVLIPKTETMESVSRMIDYIYDSKESLLLSSEHASRYFGGLKENRVISLDAKVNLAQQILQQYKDNFGYFKANRRFKTVSKEVVDRIEKLDVIGGNTLRFIVTHPGLLRESRIGGGIQINGNSYIPEKTLVRQNQYTVDIYENQIIVGFLGAVIREIERMQVSIDTVIKRRSSYNNVSNTSYMHSSYCIFQRAENSLIRNKQKLGKLYKEFCAVYSMYRNILPVKETVFDYLPRPTAIILSVPQYNNIYKSMAEWFRFGLYNLDREQFMLSFLNLSVLYEVYLLAKVVECIEKMDYQLESVTYFQYPVSHDALYQNTFCNNTYVFTKEKERLTLYYQPVIFDGHSRFNNGIGLYRNNTYSVRNDEDVFSDYGTYYYTPDYLIKKTIQGETRYAVLDAKFSSRGSLRRNHVIPLAFKYLISLTGRNGETISSLNALYGKAEEDNYRESVYNRIPSGETLKPAIVLIPFAEGVNNEMHFQYLSDIISSI